jgi:hypothetical protein
MRDLKKKTTHVIWEKNNRKHTQVFYLLMNQNPAKQRCLGAGSPTGRTVVVVLVRASREEGRRESLSRLSSLDVWS